MTFLIGLLTGLGVGSGGLYIFYLTLAKGLSQTTAQGINFVFFITASLAAAVVSALKKRISYSSVFLLVPFGILGALAGCRLASAVNARLLSVSFGVLIALTGIAGFIRLVKKH